MKKRTILIVEDDANIRDLMTLRLASKKFAILQAGDGKEGLETALAEHPDLILLDLMMPVMDGMTALKELRKDAWGATAPVIILTNLDANSESVVEDMLTGKPLHYLIKLNWKTEEVVKKIEEVLAEG